MSFMSTRYGREFHIEAPRVEDISILDIAHSLAHQCRFNGHTKRFYSVAEHSVLVSHVVPPKYALQGLLHDATEAYMGDMITPLKRLIPAFTEIENGLWLVIAQALGVAPDMHESVKQADIAVLLAEKDELITKTPTDWGIPGTPADVEILGYEPLAARALFLRRFEELTC